MFGINFAHILILLHIFFRFVETHLIIVPEIIKNSFSFEVNSHHRLTFHQFLN